MILYAIPNGKITEDHKRRVLRKYTEKAFAMLDGNSTSCGSWPRLSSPQMFEIRIEFIKRKLCIMND